MLRLQFISNLSRLSDVLLLLPALGFLRSTLKQIKVCWSKSDESSGVCLSVSASVKHHVTLLSSCWFNEERLPPKVTFTFFEQKLQLPVCVVTNHTISYRCDA